MKRSGLYESGEKLRLNLSFTVENKIGNLHNLRLFTFQTYKLIQVDFVMNMELNLWKV